MSKQKQITGQKRSAPPATDYVAGQEPQHFGNKILSGEEIDRCQKLLAISCAQDELSTRKGAGNKKFTYMEGWRVLEAANKIFGYNGWSSQILNMIVERHKEGSKFYVKVNARNLRSKNFILYDGGKRACQFHNSI
jgi:recombination DNA repair RAD52 pathway protein